MGASWIINAISEALWPCTVLDGHSFKVEHLRSFMCMDFGLSSKPGTGTKAYGPNPPCSLVFKQLYPGLSVLSTAAFSLYVAELRSFDSDLGAYKD